MFTLDDRPVFRAVLAGTMILPPDSQFWLALTDEMDPLGVIYDRPLGRAAETAWCALHAVRALGSGVAGSWLLNNTRNPG